MFEKQKKYIGNLIKAIKHGGVSYINVSFTQPAKRFEGKTVFISGGSSGLGLDMAKAFIAEGGEVIITGRKREGLVDAAKEINSSRLHTMVWDISDVSNAKKNLEELVAKVGQIDVFVNSAGVGIKYIGWNNYSPEEYERVNAINEKGMFFMCQAEADYLLAHKIQGTILNISSMASLVPTFEPYSVSKWGVNCITQGLAKVIAPYNINVNAIAPGTVMTNIEDWYKGRSIEDNAYFESQPTKRFTLKEEITSLALYLSSGAAKNITGQIIAVDGGRFLLGK